VRKVIVVSILILAIASGTAAGIMMYRILKNQPVAEAAGPQKPAVISSIVVAADRLPHGTALQPEHVKKVEWAAATTPEGSFSDIKLVIGRVIIDDVVPEEPILAARLAPEGTEGGLTSVIPKGKRAVSVRVNDVIGVAGFVLPRTRVDVLLSVNPGGQKGRSASKMILQNVEVLAAGQKIERNENGDPETVNVITLLVTPTEAEKLTLASNEGDIQLALRNNSDTDAVTTSGSRLSSLVATRRTSKARPKRPSVPKRISAVEVIKGSKRTTETF
jgi:pilus assembly protein CpaB